MMRFSLIIKGGPRDAITAANERGFEGRILDTLDVSKWETRLDVESDFPEVQAWFNENAKTKPPFPTGTLLYFNTLPDPAQQSGQTVAIETA